MKEGTPHGETRAPHNPRKKQVLSGHHASLKEEGSITITDSVSSFNSVSESVLSGASSVLIKRNSKEIWREVLNPSVIAEM
jgi:hypothetical protein